MKLRSREWAKNICKPKARLINYFAISDISHILFFSTNIL